MPMPANSGGIGAVADLGLGDSLRTQVAGETEEERRKRMLAQQQQGGQSAGAAAMLLGGYGGSTY